MSEGDTPVAERLKRRIALDGPMTVADFMQACVADPDGFYARGDAFGAGGDFVTAPEISQMFGELIGAFLVDRWQAEGAPNPFNLVELGPGRGTLMCDLLRVAAKVPEFVHASHLRLVEASANLREAQRNRLSERHHDIAFVDEVPDGAPLFLVANEFFDALPVRQLVRSGGAWHERVVGLSDDDLAFGLAPFRLPVELAAPDGAVLELRPGAEALTRTIARIIADQGGVALIIDYGYASPSFGETLQAVRKHAPVDVLHRPGEADLSAHVDFAAIARSARAVGAAVHGPVGQGPFLRALGLEARAAQLAATDDGDRVRAVEAAVARLAGTGESEMGALFKVIAITRSASAVPGFAEP